MFKLPVGATSGPYSIIVQIRNSCLPLKILPLMGQLFSKFINLQRVRYDWCPLRCFTLDYGSPLPSMNSFYLSEVNVPSSSTNSWARNVILFSCSWTWFIFCVPILLGVTLPSLPGRQCQGGVSCQLCCIPEGIFVPLAEWSQDTKRLTMCGTVWHNEEPSCPKCQ